MAKFVFNASVFDGAPLYASTIATQVTVIDADSLNLASIWSDRDGLSTMPNPFTISEAGVIEFYADAGRYNITAVNGGNTSTWNDEIVGASGGGSATASTTSTSYTLSEANAGNWMDVIGSSSVVVECPPESSVDLGSTFIHVITNYGTGSVSISEGSGVTVIPPPGGDLSIPQYGTAGIKKSDNSENTYIVFGNTAVASLLPPLISPSGTLPLTAPEILTP